MQIPTRLFNIGIAVIVLMAATLAYLSYLSYRDNGPGLDRRIEQQIQKISLINEMSSITHDRTRFIQSMLLLDNEFIKSESWPNFSRMNGAYAATRERLGSMLTPREEEIMRAIDHLNEDVSDLLRPQKKNLHIREDPRKGVYVDGVSEWAVVRPQEILELMKLGARSRTTAKTNMNESSSRSHAVFIITIEQMKENEGGESDGKEIKVAKLNLVDLAGSERVRVTGASGKRLDECKNINKSLSCLGMVIGALTDRQPQSHIPYRNSVLTRLLSDSLGGNCKTTMLTMISPAP